MLVLSRKSGERIRVGNDIRITIVRIGPGNVRIGIEAPSDTAILREELCLDVPDDVPLDSVASVIQRMV